MVLLFDKEFAEKLRIRISSAEKRADFFSAYVKTSAVEWVSSVVPEQIEVSFVARWTKNDILSGASDLEVYKLCKKLGWRFGVSPSLHAKLFVFDQTDAFVGSANLTNRGLSLEGFGNIEAGVHVHVVNSDVENLNCFLDNDVRWVDDNMYDRLAKEVENSPTEMKKPEEWSKEISELMETVDVSTFWIHELLHNPLPKVDGDFSREAFADHDRDLLSIPDHNSFTRTLVADSFKQSKVFFYLLKQLEVHDDINFGKLSSLLHGAIIDDPKPYRKDVKQLVNNIFSWVEICPEVINIVQHARTKSMRLVKRKEG